MATDVKESPRNMRRLSVMRVSIIVEDLKDVEKGQERRNKATMAACCW